MAGTSTSSSYRSSLGLILSRLSQFLSPLFALHLTAARFPIAVFRLKDAQVNAATVRSLYRWTHPIL